MSTLCFGSNYEFINEESSFSGFVVLTEMASSMASSECYFRCGKDGPLSTEGKARIETLISTSIAKNDAYVELKKQLENNPDLKITFHKNCILIYLFIFLEEVYLTCLRSNIFPSKTYKAKAQIGLSCIQLLTTLLNL